MNKTICFLLICITAISILSGCTTSYVNIFNDHVEGCHHQSIIYDPSAYQECLNTCAQIPDQNCLDLCRNVPVPLHVTLPYTFSVPRCNAANAREDFKNSIFCLDYKGCTPDQECEPTPCSNYLLPSNYRCQVTSETYSLSIFYSGGGTIYVNGVPFQTGQSSSLTVTFLDRPEEGPDSTANAIIGIPSSITVTADGDFNQEEFGIFFASICCYECREKSIPAAILYPKIDIEKFQIVDGDTIIQDGKIVSGFNIVPGTQQTKIQIENRGFFTQNDVRVRFEGLPDGINVDIEPGVQKIKAHNIGSYDATFTVGPNVPSGRYSVLMTAFSLNGTFDKIIIEIVVP